MRPNRNDPNKQAPWGNNLGRINVPAPPGTPTNARVEALLSGQAPPPQLPNPHAGRGGRIPTVPGRRPHVPAPAGDLTPAELASVIETGKLPGEAKPYSPDSPNRYQAGSSAMQGRPPRHGSQFNRFSNNWAAAGGRPVPGGALAGPSSATDSSRERIWEEIIYNRRYPGHGPHGLRPEDMDPAYANASAPPPSPERGRGEKRKATGKTERGGNRGRGGKRGGRN